jgi:ribonuclease E
MGVESQLDAMFSPTVQLRSGGYIVINQTEALVSIDVNSGRSTREHHIEDTALKTNLEAAEEVARQLRLRDLAGLIVIDFIDMDEKRNNRSVERKMSDCLRQDRARIQVGRISHFGLLEMSRQRIRASVLESSTEPCPHCGGAGHVRSVSSVALQLLRGLEETLMKGATHNLAVRTRADVALYVLNHKRGHLRDLEDGFQVTLTVLADPAPGQQSFVIERGEQVHTLEAAKALLAAQLAAAPASIDDPYDDEDPLEAEFFADADESIGEAGDAQANDLHASDEDGEGSENEGRRRKRRRRRRGGNRDGEQTEGAANAGESESSAESISDEAGEDDGDADDRAVAGEGRVTSDDPDQVAEGGNEAGRRRRRGRRGGRRRRGEGEEGSVSAIADDLGETAPSEAADAVSDLDQPTYAAARSETSKSETTESETSAESTAPSSSTADDVQRTADAPDVTEIDTAASQDHAPATTQGHAEVEVAPTSSTETIADNAQVTSGSVRRRSTVREKAPIFTSAPEASAQPDLPVADAVPPPAPEQPAESKEPRRAGWWSRRFGGGQ